MNIAVLGTTIGGFVMFTLSKPFGITTILFCFTPQSIRSCLVIAAMAKLLWMQKDSSASSRSASGRHPGRSWSQSRNRWLCSSPRRTLRMLRRAKATSAVCYSWTKHAAMPDAGAAWQSAGTGRRLPLSGRAAMNGMALDNPFLVVSSSWL